MERGAGTLASYESDASVVADWSINVIPGLLQTYEYALAYMQALGMPRRA